MERGDDIRFVKGVGEARAKALAGLGIRTLQDALDFFPRRYYDLSVPTPIHTLQDGDDAVIHGKLTAPVKTVRTRGNMTVSTLFVTDGTDELTVKIFNQEYLTAKLREGETYIFYGKTSAAGFFRELHNPQIETLDKAGIMPFYPLTATVSQRIMRKLIAEAVRGILDSVAETLPDAILSGYGLMPLRDAYREIHFPTSSNALERAKNRFVFEELLLFSLGMASLRSRRVKKEGIRLPKLDVAGEFFNALPYKMTNAQLRASRDCIRDMLKGVPMARLVQGDVGCGKTAVAALLMYYTARCGYQSCLMAPTEILAKQHFESFSTLFAPFDLRIALLTGSTAAAKRRILLERLASGEIDILIGTHAVISDGVAFHDLALCVTDEQHRFGVNQRAKLTSKGVRPHTLVMSATPIPRTLSLILYGDLDVSVIDELPPGRQKVSTHLVDSSYHERLYGFVRETVNKGGQAYVVCPLVEEGENADLRSAQEYADELSRTVLSGCRVACVHGKMAASTKNRILSEFAEGKISVLVSTTVIEVGINVPNASVMVVENAERFGLAQLHQLRGRVGRGGQKAYCFIVSDNHSEKTSERLRAFCQTTDGFEISRLDLAQRGPGDFFGVRQSGLPLFRHADLMRDLSVLEDARKAARDILSDPEWFDDPRLVTMKDAVLRLFDRLQMNILN